MIATIKAFREALEQKKVFWITDPGHGWLAVPLTEIDRLGIGPKISGYSYVGSGWHGYDGYALLEEDMDAALYIYAAFPNGVDIADFPEFTFGQPSGSVATDVRSLDSYASRKVTA
jgi:hypothetical protein